MRKFLLIAVTIFLCLKSLYSQENHPLSIGVEGAPGMGWMKPNSSNITSDGSKFGFLYGIIGEYHLTPYYLISSGIDVMYDGGKIQYNAPNPLKTEKYNLQYIEIPVTLKLKTKEYGYLSYYVQFGFGGSYNLKAKADYQSENNVDVTNKDINMFRASFIVGGGIEYSLTGNTKLLAGVTFNNGLTNILKGNSNKAINNFLGLNLGVIF